MGGLARLLLGALYDPLLKHASSRNNTRGIAIALSTGGKRLVTRLLGLKVEGYGVVGFSVNRGGSHGVYKV